jgi:hypothetical protein
MACLMGLCLRPLRHSDAWVALLWTTLQLWRKSWFQARHQGHQVVGRGTTTAPPPGHLALMTPRAVSWMAPCVSWPSLWLTATTWSSSVSLALQGGLGGRDNQVHTQPRQKPSSTQQVHPSTHGDKPGRFLGFSCRPFWCRLLAGSHCAYGGRCPCVMLLVRAVACSLLVFRCFGFAWVLLAA